MDNTYKAKGYIWFRAAPDGYEVAVETKEEQLEKITDHMKNIVVKNEVDRVALDIVEKELDVSTTCILTGERFIEDIEANAITDNDGYIDHIFVDGKISNLGISHKGVQQGKFLVNGELWKELCKEYKIEVDWVNK